MNIKSPEVVKTQKVKKFIQIGQLKNKVDQLSF